MGGHVIASVRTVTVDLLDQERPMVVCPLVTFESLRSKHQTEARNESFTLAHGFGILVRRDGKVLRRRKRQSSCAQQQTGKSWRLVGAPRMSLGQEAQSRIEVGVHL